MRLRINNQSAFQCLSYRRGNDFVRFCLFLFYSNNASLCVFFNLTLLFLSVSERIRLPKIDLMFVISSQSSKSSQTFPYMKAILTDIMQNCSTNQIHFAVVLYGNEPSVILRFSDGYTDPDKLVEEISSARNVPGGSALDKALQTAKMIFTEDEAVRPEARKILVIITDEKSSGDTVVAKGVAKDLIDNHVSIITVALGSEADRKELEELTPTDGNSLNATTDKDPGETAEEIIGKIAQRTSLFLNDYLKFLLITLVS